MSPTGICPDTFTVSSSPLGVWVGRICSGGGWKIPQKPLALSPQPLQHNTGWWWQTCSPVGSGETKPDLTRGNKHIKVKEKTEEALGRRESTGMSLSCPKNKLKRNPKHCSRPKQVKVKPSTNSIGLETPQPHFLPVNPSAERTCRNWQHQIPAQATSSSGCSPRKSLGHQPTTSAHLESIYSNIEIAAQQLILVSLTVNPSPGCNGRVTAMSQRVQALCE